MDELFCKLMNSSTDRPKGKCMIIPRPCVCLCNSNATPSSWKSFHVVYLSSDSQLGLLVNNAMCEEFINDHYYWQVMVAKRTCTWWPYCDWIIKNLLCCGYALIDIKLTLISSNVYIFIPLDNSIHFLSRLPVTKSVILLFYIPDQVDSY